MDECYNRAPWHEPYIHTSITIIYILAFDGHFYPKFYPKYDNSVSAYISCHVLSIGLGNCKI